MKSLVKTFNSFAYQHDLWTLFSDWLDLAACSISCRVDFATQEEREARWVAIKRSFDRAYGNIARASRKIQRKLWAFWNSLDTGTGGEKS